MHFQTNKQTNAKICTFDPFYKDLAAFIQIFDPFHFKRKKIHCWASQINSFSVSAIITSINMMIYGVILDQEGTLSLVGNFLVTWLGKPLLFCILLSSWWWWSVRVMMVGCIYISDALLAIACLPFIRFPIVSHNSCPPCPLPPLSPSLWNTLYQQLPPFPSAGSVWGHFLQLAPI